MADPLRNETGTPNPPPQEPILDDRSVDQLLAGLSPERTLPREENPRLNRTAETIGAALGTTVGKMRSGISLVQDRRREATQGISSTISQTSESLSAAAMEKAERLGDFAEEKVSALANSAQERWDVVSRATRNRVFELRQQAARARDREPIKVILAFAGAAFVIGIALRIWRANND